MVYDTNTVYLEEMLKLAEGLMKKGITFKFHKLYDGFQIVVFGDGDRQIWDAICHSGSYGHENGLLEIAGTIVTDDYGDVEPNLTAKDILDRV